MNQDNFISTRAPLARRSGAYRPLLPALLLVALSPAGCAEEDPEVVDPFEGAAGDVALNPEDWETVSFAEIEPPYEDSAECIEHNATEHGQSGAEVECRCNDCFDLMQECDALPGCVEIRTCGIESGCNDEFTCYLLPRAPCVEVIDKWGNAGVATALSALINDCTKANCQ